MGLIELIIVVLLILWLLGYFGRGRFSRGAPDLPASPPFGGSWIHFLLIVVLILVILRLLKVL